MIKDTINKIRAQIDPKFAFKYYWAQKDRITLSNENKRIAENCVLIGECSGNLIMEENVDVLIAHEFVGNIVGLANNNIIVTGKMTGVFSTHHLQLKYPCEISGAICIEKLYIEEGVVASVKTINEQIQKLLDINTFQDFDCFESEHFVRALNTMKPTSKNKVGDLSKDRQEAIDELFIRYS